MCMSITSRACLKSVLLFISQSSIEWSCTGKGIMPPPPPFPPIPPSRQLKIPSPHSTPSPARSPPIQIAQPPPTLKFLPTQSTGPQPSPPVQMSHVPTLLPSPSPPQVSFTCFPWHSKAGLKRSHVLAPSAAAIQS
ncbi:hypothetical protein CEUSTIGMA_g11766.t1 [Chlamydomonas eustigma]|uniref:Uncharacterized protein n=1 Tax=Chlamydomonas eustigma TaxID=1157962 RepID=A0A250XMN0_9CHLO|nr:hypothetical protein CEUSTIGMA_g11766.t1 [Chlamydomonas eustigma]|eukprot:GAX84344.1 hypothetical protein CEUSTIGMA_g11766.t1 [Chlamydomonas eustigma]